LIVSNDSSKHPAAIFPGGRTFEQMYVASRKREYRIYSDEQVLQLPSIEPSHIHYQEWQVRKRSVLRLIRYLEKKNKPLSILETGCGNGWLSGWVSVLNHSTVTGMDINKTELNQARRVFGARPNIHFVEGDLRTIEFGKKFDLILFAASVQYFPVFEKIIRQSLNLLNPAGEIHILDSPFYKKEDLEQARRRSQLYYDSIGHGEMAGFYFHHCFDSLNPFSHKFLFDPTRLVNRFFRKKDPFPWVRIVSA